MSGKLIRRASVGVLIAIAILIAGITSRTSVKADGFEQEIEVESFSWGINQTQQLRICLGNGGTSSSRSPRESVSLVFVKIQTHSGNMILNRQLSVTPGQFRCTDIFHSELIAAGLVPEATTRVQFLVNIEVRQATVGATQAVTVGAAQTRTVGSLETITVTGGSTELYKTFGLAKRR